LKEEKLYVLVRNDLSKSQKTVQAIHAAAEFLITEDRKTWDNGTVVCLKVVNEEDLKEKEKRVQDAEITYKTFREPDTGNDMTALAFVTRQNIFIDLKLL